MSRNSGNFRKSRNSETPLNSRNGLGVYSICIGFRSNEFWPKVLAESVDRASAFGLKALETLEILDALGLRSKRFQPKGLQLLCFSSCRV